MPAGHQADAVPGQNHEFGLGEFAKLQLAAGKVKVLSRDDHAVLFAGGLPDGQPQGQVNPVFLVPRLPHGPVKIQHAATVPLAAVPDNLSRGPDEPQAIIFFIGRRGLLAVAADITDGIAQQAGLPGGFDFIARYILAVLPLHFINLARIGPADPGPLAQ